MKALNDSSIRNQLLQLPLQQQLIFGAACCQRLFPLYEIFAARTGAGNSAMFSDCLERLWSRCEKAMQSNTLSEDVSSLGDYEGGDVTACWGQFGAKALEDCLATESKVPLVNLQSYCLDSIATVLDESGFVVEADFRTREPYCAYNDQAEFLHEYAAERELLSLINSQAGVGASLTQIRRFCREYPVLGHATAMSFVMRHDKGFDVAEGIREIVEFLMSNAQQGPWPADIRNEVIHNLTRLGIDRYAAAIVWGAAKDLPESIRDLLIDSSTGIAQRPMLEYLMHIVANRQAKDEWRRLSLSAIVRACPGSWRVTLETAPVDPWTGMILCALDALSSLADHDVKWLIHRYVAFPVASISHHARMLVGEFWEHNS